MLLCCRYRSFFVCASLHCAHSIRLRLAQGRLQPSAEWNRSIAPFNPGLASGATNLFVPAGLGSSLHQPPAPSGRRPECYEQKTAEERLLLRRWEDNELNPSVHGDVLGGFEHRARRGVCLHGQATRSAGHADVSIQGAAFAIVLLHAIHINLHAADRHAGSGLRSHVHRRTYGGSGIGQADGD